MHDELQGSAKIAGSGARREAEELSMVIEEVIRVLVGRAAN